MALAVFLQFIDFRFFSSSLEFSGLRYYFLFCRVRIRNKPRVEPGPGSTGFVVRRLHRVNVDIFVGNTEFEAAHRIVLYCCGLSVQGGVRRGK